MRVLLALQEQKEKQDFKIQPIANWHTGLSYKQGVEY